MFVCFDLNGKYLAAFTTLGLAKSAWNISYSSKLQSPEFRDVDFQTTHVYHEDQRVGKIERHDVFTQAQHL